MSELDKNMSLEEHVSNKKRPSSESEVSQTTKFQTNYDVDEHNGWDEEDYNDVDPSSVHEDVTTSEVAGDN